MFDPFDEWIKKFSIYIMVYYATIIKDEIMQFASTWIEVETVGKEQIQNDVSFM